MADVHPDDHLSLVSVQTEMSLADQKAGDKTPLEVIEIVQTSM